MEGSSFWSKLSIRLKISSMLVPALFLILVIVWISYSASRGSSLEASERIVQLIVQGQTQRLNTLLSRQASTFDRWIQEDIYGLAIESKTVKELEQHLQEMVAGSGFSLLLVTDRKGRVLTYAGDRSNSVGMHALNREVVKGVAGLLSKAPSGVTLVERDLLGQSTERYRRTFLFSAPTEKSSGQVNGLLLGYMDWSAFQEAMDNMAASLRDSGFPDARAALVDITTQTALSHSIAELVGTRLEMTDALKRWLRESDDGEMDTFSLSGRKEYVTLAHVMDPSDLQAGESRSSRTSPLMATVFIPERNMLSEGSSVLWSGILIALMGILVLVGLAWTVSGRISKPIHEIQG